MSPAVDAKALRAAIKDLTFAPAYYFHGEDDYLKNEELRRLIDAAVDPATRDFNFETLRGAEIDAETLGSIVGTPPMMADRRMIVIRDVNALKKDARAMLDKYLKSPAPDLVLVLLVSRRVLRRTRVYLATASALEFEPLSGNRIPKWITYYVEHDLGSDDHRGCDDAASGSRRDGARPAQDRAGQVVELHGRRRDQRSRGVGGGRRASWRNDG